MVDPKQVWARLRDIDCDFAFFGRPELRELPTILQPGEVVAQCVNGFYEIGFATLCVTNERLLLIDRRTFFTTIEDIHFDMIAEITYSRRLVTSVASIFTPNRTLRFTTHDQPRMARCIDYLQQRVMESRQRQAASPQQGDIHDVRPAELVLDSVASASSVQPVNVFARLAMQGIDRAAHVPAVMRTRLPLFRRRRYPSFMVGSK